MNLHQQWLQKKTPLPAWKGIKLKDAPSPVPGADESRSWQVYCGCVCSSSYPSFPSISPALPITPITTIINNTPMLYNLFIQVHITIESILILFVHRNHIYTWCVTNNFLYPLCLPCINKFSDQLSQSVFSPKNSITNIFSSFDIFLKIIMSTNLDKFPYYSWLQLFWCLTGCL